MYDGVMTLTMNDYRGLSAYEIAVKNGFEGSETEWLASLKGEDGASAEAVTVNRKRAVDGNITVNGTDVYTRAGVATTVTHEIESLKTEKLSVKDVVNDLNSTNAQAALSAAQGGAILKKAECLLCELTVPTDLWEGDGPYTLDVTVEGVKAGDGAVLSFYPDGGENETAFSDCVLVLTGVKDGAVTLRVDNKPATAFLANLLVVRPGVNS